MIIASCVLSVAGLLGGLINRLLEIRESSATPDQEEISPSGQPKNNPGPKGGNALHHGPARPGDQLAVAALPYLFGFAAAWCVPLFLSLTKGTLFAEAERSDEGLAVLFGLGIVAALSSRRFLDTLAEKVFDAIKKVDKTTRETARTAEQAKETAEQASAQNASNALKSEHNPPSEQNKAINETLEPDESRILRVFAIESEWAPSIRGVINSTGLDEAQSLKALKSLTFKGLLNELPTTPTRSMVRWTITERGRNHKSV